MIHRTTHSHYRPHHQDPETKVINQWCKFYVPCSKEHLTKSKTLTINWIIGQVFNCVDGSDYHWAALCLRHMDIRHTTD